MPIKVMILLKRKPGLSPEEFRHGYETSHSRLGIELFGHLWQSYRRTYLGSGTYFAQQDVPCDSGMDGPDEFGFDAITEIVYKDGADMAEVARIGAANRDRIVEDELHWFHRKRCWIVGCDTVEEDLGVLG